MAYNSKYHRLKESVFAWVRKYGLNVRFGGSIRQMCKDLGISERTYEKWAKNSDFSGGVSAANEFFLASRKEKYVATLDMIARGYEHTEIRKRGTETPKGTTTEIIETTKYYPPDEKALEMILRSEWPDEWPDTKHIDVTSAGKQIYGPEPPQEWKQKAIDFHTNALKSLNDE